MYNQTSTNPTEL